MRMQITKKDEKTQTKANENEHITNITLKFAEICFMRLLRVHETKIK